MSGSIRWAPAEVELQFPGTILGDLFHGSVEISGYNYLEAGLFKLIHGPNEVAHELPPPPLADVHGDHGYLFVGHHHHVTVPLLMHDRLES